VAPHDIRAPRAIERAPSEVDVYEASEKAVESEAEQSRGVDDSNFSGHCQTTSLGVMYVKSEPRTDTSNDANNQDEILTVPITMSLGIISGYLFVGSILFGVWEGWDPLGAAYFCFVTISTIGFGDLVPGSGDNFQSEGDDWKIASAAMFILLGMVLLSMCVNLIGEVMREKVRYIIDKFGWTE